MKTVYATILIQLLVFFLISDASQAVIRDRSEYEKTGNVIWDIETDDKVVALTFDDGPHRLNTPMLLNVLDEYNVQATFFVVGEDVKEHPDIVKRILFENHEIGNHTFTHDYNEAVSKASLSQEIEQTDILLMDMFGIKPLFFRPVGGYYNDDIIDVALEKEHKISLWSWHQDPRDWDNRSKKQIVSHVLSNIQPGDVILLHDGGGDRSETVEAVKEIIPTLQKQGYTFLTLSELTGHQPFTIEDYLSSSSIEKEHNETP